MGWWEGGECRAKQTGGEEGQLDRIDGEEEEEEMEEEEGASEK